MAVIGRHGTFVSRPCSELKSRGLLGLEFPVLKEHLTVAGVIVHYVGTQQVHVSRKRGHRAHGWPYQLHGGLRGAGDAAIVPRVRGPRAHGRPLSSVVAKPAEAGGRKDRRGGVYRWRSELYLLRLCGEMAAWNLTPLYTPRTRVRRVDVAPSTQGQGRPNSPSSGCARGNVRSGQSHGFTLPTRNLP